MSDKKVVDAFQQRRELSLALDALAIAPNEVAMIDAAHGIVETFPVDLILSNLVKRLDSADSNLRGGLGHVAALLPAERATPVLLRAVADRNASPERRIGAALILERYLDHVPPSGVLNDLENNNEVAFQSLVEAIDLGKKNRHVLLEYVTQMRQAPAEVAPMVMDMLVRIDPTDRVELLRLISLDDRPTVARDAQQRLDLLARDAERTSALRALHTLQFVQPAALADEMTRRLRKLRFAGFAYQPPTPEGWRALVTPPDPGGFQTVWLVHYPEKEGDPGKIVGALLNQQMGIRQLFASEDLPVEHLPVQRSPGEMVAADVGGGQHLQLLTTAFDYGRWLLWQASMVQFEEDPTWEMPGEYRLLNDLIWAYAAPVVSSEIASCFRAERWTPTVEEMEPLADAAEAVLLLPAMAPWTRQNFLLIRATESLHGELAALPTELMVRHIQREFAALSSRETLTAALENGLRTAAAWLYAAGDSMGAEQALLMATSMQQLPIESNPFFTVLIALGLQNSPPTP